MKGFLQIFALLCGSVLVFLVAAEVVLRFLPVNGALIAEPVSAENPVFHFQPDQTLTWSRGPMFSMVNEIVVNGSGYVHNEEYRHDDTRPLVAVVGDSQVEAAMVPFEETVHARLAKTTGGRVYSFAASGAPLSQYLAWAKHAKENWGAGFLIVVIIGNDFDESLLRYKKSPGFHYYAEREGGELALQRIDYSPNPLREMVRISALARYLLFNVQILERLKKLAGHWSIDAHAGEKYAGNTSTAMDPLRVDLSKRAVDAFLRDIRAVAGWSEKEVLFVVDGFRYPERARRQAGSYFGEMRRYFISSAAGRDYSVIDMDRVFLPEHIRSGAAFEFPNDGHWTGRAHEMAAGAILENALFRRWADFNDFGQ